MADKTHQQALDRFKAALDATQSQRDREADDLAFQIPDNQWPNEIRSQRAGQIIAGVSLPPRPMLAIPTLDQPIQLALNQERAAHLGVQVHALTDDADDDTAEVLQGLYRRIEVDSRANLARSWAHERAVKCGRGAYRVNKVYDADSPNHFDQKIVIQRLLHQEAAVFDPFAQEPDWSDGRYAFVTSWVPRDRYKAKYGDSKLAKSSDSDLLEISTTTPEWIRGEGDACAFLVAEYWRVEIDDKTAVLLDDGSTAFDDAIPEGRTVVTGDGARSVPCEHRRVIWSTINAVETLEPEQAWDGQYVPLIPTIGRELIPYDGERRFVGVIGPNKDAARLFNYAASGAVEMAALETKAPYLLVEGQEEGHETEFALANVRNFPYLRYRNVSLNGTPAPPPQRTQIDTSRLGPSMLLLQQARDFIHTGTGAYEPSLGQESTRQRSGRAVLALQQQHDQGTSHFLDNLAEISMMYEARVVIDLIPHVYDRDGRVARILDAEDHAETVMLNRPFLPSANGRPQPLPYSTPQEQQQTNALVANPNHPATHYDLRKGRYGVTVSVGKAYKSRLEEGTDMLAQLFQAEPATFQILGDIWLKFQTWPGHQEASERMKKMLPPPLQDQQQQPDAARELQQAKAAMQQMQQQLQQMGQALATDQVKASAEIQKAQIAKDKDIQLQAMRDATSIAVAKINAAAKGYLAQQEDLDEAIALAQQQQFTADQAQQDRAHDVALAAQDHAHTLAQGQQAAALAPPPTNNGGGEPS